jgi:hypothetical protein
VDVWLIVGVCVCVCVCSLVEFVIAAIQFFVVVFFFLVVYFHLCSFMLLCHLPSPPLVAPPLLYAHSVFVFSQLDYDIARKQRAPTEPVILKKLLPKPLLVGRTADSLLNQITALQTHADLSADQIAEVFLEKVTALQMFGHTTYLCAVVGKCAATRFGSQVLLSINARTVELRAVNDYTQVGNRWHAGCCGGVFVGLLCFFVWQVARTLRLVSEIDRVRFRSRTRTRT